MTIKNKTLKLNQYFCEGCGACEVVCPYGAITMKKVNNAEIRIKNNVWGFPLVSAQLYPGESGSGKVVDEIKKEAEKINYEVMILDSAAGTGCPVISALNGSDWVVLITEPTLSGLTDLKRVLQVVRHFNIPFGIVINKWDINRKISRKIRKEFEAKLLGQISYDQKIFKTIASLTPVIKTSLPAKQEIKKIFVKLKKAI